MSVVRATLIGLGSKLQKGWLHPCNGTSFRLAHLVRAHSGAASAATSEG